MNRFPQASLGEFLTHRAEFITIEDDLEYKRARVQLYGRGIVLRDSVPGAEIRTKKQQVAMEGEFLVAEIDAKVGGFGIVPPELKGALVNSHYFLFRIDEGKCLKGWLDAYIKLGGLQEQVSARGSTNYAAIRPAQVLQLQIPLPPLDEQRRIVERIKELAAKISAVRSLREETEGDLRRFLGAAYHRIAAGAPRKPLGEVAPLNRRLVTVELDRGYPQVAVRSYGRGTFHKPPLEGNEVTWQKLFLVKAGDILVSNIKAWEGALAVAGTRDDGRVGSHRYLTCVPVPDVATAPFVCFHLLSPEGLSAVGKASPGSADRNRTLSARAFLEIPVPVPDYSKQLWFDALYHRADELKGLHTETSREVDAILPSVLYRIFRGDLEREVV
jgi:type I restriction enzyme S subunit